jgi:hypothetical protein
MGKRDPVLASILTLLPLAEGRSENPGDGGGILVILGVIALMVIVIVTAWTLIARATSKRRGRASGTGG